MTNLQLEGQVDTRDQDLVDARNKIRDLEHQLEGARMEIEHARAKSFHSVSRLREALNPLWNALQVVYGEMDKVDGGKPVTSSPGADNSKWETVKQRLSPKMREAIDILLVQGSMKRTQIATAMKMDYSNCTKNVIGVLLRQGLLEDNGGNLSLKKI